MKEYRFTHLPTGFEWKNEYGKSIIIWAKNGGKEFQDKIRARMYGAVASLDDAERRRQIQQDHSEFLWPDIVVAAVPAA